MKFNKNVLAIAIVGTLSVAGNVAAANLSADPVVPAYFAKEIVISDATNGRQIGTDFSANTRLTWDINYNFSPNEVRYVRLECSDTIKFDPGSVVDISNADAVTGSLNGLGTNVVTFSLTSDPALTGNDIVAADTLTFRGDHFITSTAQDVNCTASLYDQPSQAQAGGSAGLIANATSSGAYLRFADSYELVATPTEHVADVEADPSFSAFVIDANTTAAIASLGNNTVTYRLRDPDPAGAQNVTYGIDGDVVLLSDLLANTTTIQVAGDYALAANATGTPYNGAALGRVQLAGVNAAALTASLATFNVGNTAFTNQDFNLTENTDSIAEADYTATLKAVAAASADYAVKDLTTKLGSIVRNGTELQAPLAQIPAGWLSRLVLTNTGGADRPYSIKVLTEEGVTVSTGTLTGTIPAGKTKVIDDLKTVFTGNNRATLVVNVAGPTKQIQGLYQIVNPEKGSISNHVLVRPGSN
jgi:hypothetical protein